MKKAMISQPMKSKDRSEIENVRTKAIAELHKLNYEVIDTYFVNEWRSYKTINGGDINNEALFCLAKSLECMSTCQAVYFCKGWEKARGCRIEHETAIAYGLQIIYEQ